MKTLETPKQQGFNFERDLPHQTKAIESTLLVFENIYQGINKGINKDCVNPLFDFENSKTIYCENLQKIKKRNNIEERVKK